MGSMRGALVASVAASFIVVACGTSYSAEENACPAGFGACEPPSAECRTDLRTTTAHCGACGNVCPSNKDAFPVCNNGVCGIGCNAGFGDCDGNIGNGCETPTSNDTKNCGACGKPCPGNTECSDGVCRAICNVVGLGDCNGNLDDGCETQLATSNTHCGKCNAACAPGQTCLDSTCGPASSCKALLGQTPALPSGVYTIDPDGKGPTAPFETFCDLDPTSDGGGWTLVAKIDGSKSTFRFGATLWTSDALLNPESTALDNEEAKLGGFLSMVGTTIRLGMREGVGPIRWATFDPPRGGVLNNDTVSLREGFAAIFTSPTGGDRASWEGLLTAPNVQNECNRQGYNVVSELISVRLGMIFDSAPDCKTAGSFIGIGSSVAAVSAGTWRKGIQGGPAPQDMVRPVMAYLMLR